VKWKINTCSLVYQTGISRTLVVFVFHLYGSHYYTTCKIVRYSKRLSGWDYLQNDKGC